MNSPGTIVSCAPGEPGWTSASVHPGTRARPWYRHTPGRGGDVWTGHPDIDMHGRGADGRGIGGFYGR